MKMVVAIAGAVAIGWGASLATAKTPTRSATVESLSVQVSQLRTEVAALKADLRQHDPSACAGCQNSNVAEDVARMANKLRQLCSAGRLLIGVTVTNDTLQPEYVTCPYTWP